MSENTHRGRMEGAREVMMSFRKNDRVEVRRNPSEVLYGTVTKGGRVVHVQLDNGRTVKGPESIWRHSTKPRPAGVALPTSFKKGDRVEFDDNGVTKIGVVAKGGSGRIMVIYDGGSMQIRGGAQLFRHTDAPLPKDEPSAVDGYSLRGYKEINGHGDSRTFEATILKDGKPIGTVMNNGWGGCNEYYAGVNGSSEELRLLDAAVESAFIQFGSRDRVELTDQWVEWYQHERPFGVTLRQSIANTNAMYEKYE